MWSVCGMGIVDVWLGRSVRLCGSLVLVLFVGCTGMPTLEEQQRFVQAENLVLDQITTEAVVSTWGAPSSIIMNSPTFL